MVTALIIIGIVFLLAFTFFLWALVAGADDTRKERLYREELRRKQEMEKAQQATGKPQEVAEEKSDEFSKG